MHVGAAEDCGMTTNRGIAGPAPPRPLELDIPAHANIAAMLDAIESWLAARAESAALTPRVALVAEELAVNAFHHGGAAGSGGVRIRLEQVAGIVRGQCSYRGTQFDPSDPANRAGDDPLSLGGQGLRLIQSMTSQLDYRFHDGTNIVDFEIAQPSR